MKKECKVFSYQILLDLNIIYSIQLDGFDRNLTARLIKNEEGFTLVELIVVVVIIGILSSIAVPSFQDATKKARQRGVAAQISTYIKGSQAFYTEYGTPRRNAGNLSEFADVIECRDHLISSCKGQANNHRNLGQSFPGSDQWNSTSGMYTISMRSSNQNRFRLNAFPQRQDSRSSIRSDEDYGVSGCFNYNTGATSVVIWDQIGHRSVRDLNC